MNRLASALLLIASASFAVAAPPSVTANAPIRNFKLPVLNQDGVRTSLLRGTEAHYRSSSQIDIIEMQYTLFTEDGKNRVDTTLLAPVASVLIENEHVKVHGDQQMRLLRPDLELKGERWTYDHRIKKVLIEKDVHVIFRMEFKDILK